MGAASTNRRSNSVFFNIEYGIRTLREEKKMLKEEIEKEQEER